MAFGKRGPLVHSKAEKGADAGRKHSGQTLRRHLPAGEEAAPPDIRMLNHECRCRAKFAAGRKALQHARNDNDQRRCDADPRVGRETQYPPPIVIADQFGVNCRTISRL